jgi:hypothetical protein
MLLLPLCINEFIYNRHRNRNLTSRASQSAPSSCFNYSGYNRQAQGVAMTWATSDNQIVQFVVEKSYDDYYYESAGAVNNNNNGSFKFVDNDVLPRFCVLQDHGY